MFTTDQNELWHMNFSRTEKIGVEGIARLIAELDAKNEEIKQKSVQYSKRSPIPSPYDDAIAELKEFRQYVGPEDEVWEWDSRGPRVGGHWLMDSPGRWWTKGLLIVVGDEPFLGHLLAVSSGSSVGSDD
jgi:hypothetical protein